MRGRDRVIARAVPLPLLAVLMASVLVACGSDNGEEGSSTTTTSAPGTTSTTEASADQTEVRAYFLRDELVGPVAREATDEATMAGAVEGLLAGPTPAEREIGFSTSIPAGTTLRGITVENRVATVDLSGEFASGGGSASMQGRVAQVVFTLTQFPDIDAVNFELDGGPLTVLGGEGLLLEEPQRRSHWEDFSPAILVESPLPLEEVESPLRITGTANTFEAVFWVNITDGEGLIVYDERAMATSGTGTRGSFEVTATFEVPRPGLGAVIVFEKSPKDGQQTHVVEIPIKVGG